MPSCLPLPTRRMGVVIDVRTKESPYKPGECVQGTAKIYAHSGVEVDCIEARLLGTAQVAFTNKEHYSFAKKRVIVDSKKELWKYRSLNSMLGLNTDENANKDSSSTGRLLGTSSYDFTFRLPADAPTTFHCPGSPVTVKYWIEISLLRKMHVVSRLEHQLNVLRPEAALGGKDQKSSTHSKHYRFPKDRDVFLECVLDRTVFTTVDSIGARITVTNKWKRSLKYVHISFVKRISVNGNLIEDEHIEESHTVLIETTGVGLPPEKAKIPVGETYSFQPDYHVPALPPSSAVDGIMKNDYYLKICAGRAHNFIIASLWIPVTIVSEFVEAKERVRSCSAEEQLIDLAPPLMPDLLA